MHKKLPEKSRDFLCEKKLGFIYKKHNIYYDKTENKLCTI